MKHLYRFRPLKRLLGQNELLNQEIFFASPDQLNDPMEGLRDVVWQGDAIVWKNFFRHYSICLDNAFSQLMLSGEGTALEWKNIPVFNCGGLNDGLPHKAVETEILTSLFSEPRIQRLIDALASNSLPIRRDELAAHLRAIHPFVIALIGEAYTRRGFQVVNSDARAARQSALQSIDYALHSIDALQAVCEQQRIDEFQAESLFVSRKLTTAQLDLINFYNGRIDFSQSNRNFILLSFPDEFVRQVEVLAFPDWYAACFMTDCRNSANWGSYGDRHTAVCMKFKLTVTHNKPSMLLRRQIGLNAAGPIVDFTPHEFKQIIYENRPEPVDFFRTLGRFPIPDLRRYWYSDENGNQSRCGDEIFQADDAWRKRYWDIFYHAITRKLSDWAHEQEYRLILDDYFLNYRDPSARTLNYQFAELEGLIFGINTPMQAKLDICRIIEQKCRAEQRTDFKFYQAFYSRRTGAIEHSEIGLLKFQF